MNRKYFSDVIRDICANLQEQYDPEQEDLELRKPIYEHDCSMKLSEKLSQKDESDKYVYHKYPMIALIEPFKEVYGESLDYWYSVNCTIIFVTETQPTWDSEKRLNENYKKILQPLVDQFIEALCDSTHIKAIRENLVYEQYRRPDWGAEGVYGNRGLIFNDSLDIIMINFSKLLVNFNNSTCDNTEGEI